MSDSKRLPRIPTREMIEAAINAPDIHDAFEVGGPLSAAVMDEYQAAYDAAPPVRLTRTDPPTEPGWYWGRIRNEDYRPEPLGVFRVGGTLAVHWGTRPADLGGFDWFGPLELPEVSP